MSGRVGGRQGRGDRGRGRGPDSHGRDGGRRGRGPRGGGRGAGRGRGTPKTEQEGLAATQRAFQGLRLRAPTQEKLPNGLAKRPDFGQAGQRIRLFANHFAITCKSEQAFHYDVDVQPLKSKKVGAESKVVTAAKNIPLPQNVCQKAIQEVAKQQNWEQGWVFDGKKNLYAPMEILPKQQRFFEVEVVEEEGDRPRRYEVITQFAAKVDLLELQRYMQHGAREYPQAAVQAMEVALRHGASMSPKVVTSARALYFYNREEVRSLGGGAEVWLGYHQSLRPCQLGLTLNIDTAATAFLERRPVIQLLAEAAGARAPNDIRMDKKSKAAMKRAVKGILVREMHRPQYRRKRRVAGLTDKPAKDAMFEMEDGQRISVAEYFKRTYEPLKFPQLPCLDFSTPSRVTYMPPECCEVVQGQRRKKLTDFQTSNMIRAAAQHPQQRRQYIQDVLVNKAKLDKDPSLRRFGIGVTPKMVEVEGRILPQPHLQYRDPKCLDVGTGGAWNLEKVTLFEPSEIKSWVFLNLVNPRAVDVPGESGIQGFKNDLVRSLRNVGMTVPNDLPIHNGNPHTGGVLPCMQQACSNAMQKFQRKPDIILVLIEKKEASIYREVKRASDSYLGIPSQCIVSNNALRTQVGHKRLQYCANIALKVNAKVGGKNCKIVGQAKVHFPVVGDRPFIIFGADVTHPTTEDKTEPSVAGLVASLDAYATRFAARVIFQANRQEYIDLKDAAKELLREFYQNTNHKPEKIIFYRDGVSEGQFSHVLELEYEQLRKACLEMGDPSADYCPPITFIVVQKRHHTRLFPAANEGDRNGNVLPGTIVDRGIGHPFEFDFFLNSHAGIQGTNKPAHYHVLVDENKFGADGISLMTFWLCFLYCRCTRSVSYCPPAYYAHLAAFRGKLMTTSSDSSSESGSGDFGERLRIHGSLNGVMYFV